MLENYRSASRVTTIEVCGPVKKAERNTRPHSPPRARSGFLLGRPHWVAVGLSTTCGLCQAPCGTMRRLLT